MNDVDHRITALERRDAIETAHAMDHARAAWEPFAAEVHVRPVSNPDAAWEPFGTVSRDAGIVDIPDTVDAWPTRPRYSFTRRFTALEDTMTPVLRTVGESMRYTWDAYRDALNLVLFDMLIPTNERSARKTANARRNRLRRKRNRRRRRRG